jgi:hypothetical protein
MFGSCIQSIWFVEKIQGRQLSAMFGAHRQSFPEELEMDQMARGCDLFVLCILQVVVWLSIDSVTSSAGFSSRPPWSCWLSGSLWTQVNDPSNWFPLQASACLSCFHTSSQQIAQLSVFFKWSLNFVSNQNRHICCVHCLCVCVCVYLCVFLCVCPHMICS